MAIIIKLADKIHLSEQIYLQVPMQYYRLERNCYFTKFRYLFLFIIYDVRIKMLRENKIFYSNISNYIYSKYIILYSIKQNNLYTNKPFCFNIYYKKKTPTVYTNIKTFIFNFNEHFRIAILLTYVYHKQINYFVKIKIHS